MCYICNTHVVEVKSALLWYYTCSIYIALLAVVHIYSDTPWLVAMYSVV